MLRFGRTVPGPGFSEITRPFVTLFEYARLTFPTRQSVRDIVRLATAQRLPGDLRHHAETGYVGEHRDAVGDVGGGQLRLGIAVQVADRDRDGKVAGCVVEPALEGAVAPAREHGDGVLIGVRGRQLRLAVGVQVADRDRVGPSPAA